MNAFPTDVGESLFGRVYHFEFIPKVPTHALPVCLTIYLQYLDISSMLSNIDRLFMFVFYELQGFMGRLIIRLLAFPLAAQLYWRHGVLAQIGKYFTTRLSLSTC